MITTMIKMPPPAAPPTVLAVLPAVATEVDIPVEEVLVMLELVLNSHSPFSRTYVLLHLVQVLESWQTSHPNPQNEQELDVALDL